MAAASNTRQNFPTSFLIRLAMRASRARWFIFLRRVFHYQNGSRSDLGANPFESTTWMISELIALLVQITVITFTLALSKNERPIWPVRLWITGYNVGCLLSLMLLYGRYRQQDTSQGNGFSFGDIEQQQQRSREETRLTIKTLIYKTWNVMNCLQMIDSPSLCVFQVLTFDEQMQDLAGTVLCDMVCDRKRMGVWFPVRFIPLCAKPSCPLHLTSRLERSLLLLPVSSLPPAMLCCASHQQLPRLQHERRILRERSFRWPDLKSPELEVQTHRRRNIWFWFFFSRKKWSGVLHMSGEVQRKRRSEKATVFA